MIITTEEVVEMEQKLWAASTAFKTLRNGCGGEDFALRGYYDMAAEAFGSAANKMQECIRFCPKMPSEQAKGAQQDE